MEGAEAAVGPCRVRIGAGSPCPRPAVTEVLGLPFCERCAEGQRAHFTIGEVMLSQGLPNGRAGVVGGFLNEPLADALHRMRREFVERAAR